MIKNAKDKSKSSKKRHKWGSLALALLLLTPGLLISGEAQTVEGAAYTHISSVEAYDDYARNLNVFSLNNGYKVLLSNSAEVTPVASEKYYAFYDSYGSTKIGYVYLQNGKLMTQKIGESAVQKTDNVTDFQLFTNTENSNIDKFSYFVLKNDGTVWAWGAGARGQLAMGGASDKTVPTQVLDPFGEVLTGVKKLYYLSSDSFLAVKDNAVYLIGTAFGKTSLTTPTSKAVDISSLFPAFTSFDNFQMNFLNNYNYSRINTRPGTANSSDVYANTASRIFTINGQSYSLTNWNKYRNPTDGSSELDSTPTLTSISSGIDITNVHRYINTAKNPFAGTNYLSSGYTTIKNGELKYWGTPYSGWMYGSDVMDAMKTVATGVESVVGDGNGTFWYLKGGNAYAFGSNISGRSGIAGGTLTDPVRITGPNNEIMNVKQIASSGYQTYALKDNHEVIAWSSDSTFTTLTKKYLSLYSVPDRYGKYSVFGITEAGDFVRLPDGTTVTGFPKVYPEDYVVPVVLDTPTGSVSVDKFQQSVITVDYGSSSDVDKREYSINGGITWVPYTQPVTLAEVGKIPFKARSSAKDGTYSKWLELEIANKPIVIQSGYPQITDNGNGSFTVDTGTTSLDAKTEIRIDNGTWVEYTGPVTLPSGSHIVDVRVVNPKGDELATGNKTINGPTPLPTPTPTVAPTPTVVPTSTPTTTPTPHYTDYTNAYNGAYGGSNSHNRSYNGTGYTSANRRSKLGQSDWIRRRYIHSTFWRLQFAI